jgi:formylglycine-generating enzyme required for sulfatase activity
MSSDYTCGARKLKRVVHTLALRNESPVSDFRIVLVALVLTVASYSIIGRGQSLPVSTSSAKPAPLTAPFDERIARDAQKSWADYLAVRTQILSSIGATLVLIPPGKFTMGTPVDERGPDDNEGPQHKVTLSRAFYMGITPVTQGQWKALMGANNNPSSSIYSFGDDSPVNNVSWNDAVDFCNKLSKKESKIYRLPTEAEWEYACRAGTITAYFTGNGEDSLKKAGWYDGNSSDESHPRGYMHPVGQKAANGFGLYDMHGNQYQWCSDWYADKYVEGEQTDPIGPINANIRVLRGSSWISSSEDCRSGRRTWHRPETRDFFVGFRLVMDVK